MNRPRRIAESTFFIAVNGAPDSPPASAMRDFLIDQGARRLTTSWHPLQPEDDQRHQLTTYEAGRLARRRLMRLPSHVPLTYPIDLLVPPWPPRVDLWIAYNNLHVAHGLVARRLGRATAVAYHAVDFVPDRFGRTSPLTAAYDFLDAQASRRADVRWEVSPIALQSRDERHSLGAEAAPSMVVPMGAWTGRTPKVPADGYRSRKVLFTGELVERQGVGVLIRALALLRDRNVEVTAELAGRGALEDELRTLAADLGLSDDRVRFLGFIDNHRRLEALLATGSVGVAPYDTTVESFTRYADPSKLKSYAGAGLPVVTTSVPPNADDMERRGGAEAVDFSPEAIAAGIERALSSDSWGRRRRAALDYAGEFDWQRICADALRSVGFVS